MSGIVIVIHIFSKYAIEIYQVLPLFYKYLVSILGDWSGSVMTLQIFS